MEQIEAEMDTIMSNDYPNEVPSPEASNLEEPYEQYPISSYMLDIGVYSNTNVPDPTFESSNLVRADPHTSFWREPFSFENVYDDIDEYGTYVDPQSGVQNLGYWFN